MNYTDAGVRAATSSRRCSEACDEKGIPHPDIVTETGRAHGRAPLGADLQRAGRERGAAQRPAPSRARARRAQGRARAVRGLAVDHAQERPWRPTTTRCSSRKRRSRCSTSATLDLRDARALERLFWACCEKILRIVRELDYVPEELEGLEKAPGRHLLRQLLGVPVGARPLGGQAAVPDHADPPPRRAADPARRLRRPDLRLRRQDRPVHRPARRQARARAAPARTAEPYYIGVFLVGAYQEILGDLHNLFGDTDAVHVRLGEDDRIEIEHVVEGDSVEEVLGYVQYDRKRAGRADAPRDRGRAAREAHHGRGVGAAEKEIPARTRGVHVPHSGRVRYVYAAAQEPRSSRSSGTA